MSILSGLFSFIACSNGIRKLDSKKEERKSLLNFRFFFAYAFPRYIRTMPVIIGNILIIFAMPLIGAKNGGPVHSETMANITGNCYYHGWKEIAGISSFFKHAEKVWATNYYCFLIKHLLIIFPVFAASLVCLSRSVLLSAVLPGDDCAFKKRDHF